jgi:nucleotide-binding universal stress UspA family protein
MQKLFNKILVPVDFSEKSTDILEKAFSFASRYNCSIHLLHVAAVSPFAAIPILDGKSFIPYNLSDNTMELNARLEKICTHIASLSGHTIQVEYSVIRGTWNQGIIDFVNENNADLVLIGQKGNFLQKRKMQLNPDLIAEKTNTPVITVPSNRRIIRFYSIVIPITDFLPVRKLMYGVYMGLNLETTIKLLGVENEKTKDKVQYYLDKANKLIRDNCDIRVETETVFSKNIAQAINHFAINKAADLVIVNPGTQTKMPGIFSSLLGNIIQKYAAPPVLAINGV